MFETLSMIGLGYIGLPTATLFASRRKKVIGVDVNAYAVDTRSIKAGFILLNLNWICWCRPPCTVATCALR